MVIVFAAVKVTVIVVDVVVVVVLVVIVVVGPELLSTVVNIGVYVYFLDVIGNGGGGGSCEGGCGGECHRDHARAVDGHHRDSECSG